MFVRYYLIILTVITELNTEYCCSVSVRAVNKMPLNQLAKMSATASKSTADSTATLLLGGTGMPVTDVRPLSDVFVPIETIQPGNSALTSPSLRERLQIS